MSITIKDIAKIAGVSHTTVSRALNESPLIKEETKKRIQKIANDLAFTSALALRSGTYSKSNNIGLFFSSITVGTSVSFFQEIVAGVSEKTHGQYNLVINALDTYKSFNDINKKSYDGIILVSQTEKDDVFIKEMIKKEIPIVVLNRNVHKLKVMNVLSDDEAGVYDGVSYLINHGHKEIGLIEGREDFESSRLRKLGYVKALRDYSIDLFEKYIVSGDYTINGGYQGMMKLLKLDTYPTAVFCSNDDMAFGAIKAIHEVGLQIPRDIAIMGFDDSLFAEYMTPPLTTIKRPISEISSGGIQLLLKLMEEEGVKVQKIYIPSSLVSRQSV